ncbi:hypothetical protein OSTOST_23587 [Ostertagia ostertagi]
MEIAMIVAAVILLNLILGCKNKSTKVSKSTPSPMSKGKKSPQTAKLKSIRTGEEETQIATEKKEQTTALATEETQIKQSLEDLACETLHIRQVMTDSKYRALAKEFWRIANYSAFTIIDTVMELRTIATLATEAWGLQ